jgi:putative component of membrane protein insertase Oxa1/YidC/SpoIIIJ protein YidD
MILAIQKYGLIKGIKKGVRRIKRCHYPNGGIDYP